jgi:hypothetical protein
MRSPQKARQHRHRRPPIPISRRIIRQPQPIRAPGLLDLDHSPKMPHKRLRASPPGAHLLHEPSKTILILPIAPVREKVHQRPRQIVILPLHRRVPPLLRQLQKLLQRRIPPVAQHPAHPNQPILRHNAGHVSIPSEQRLRKILRQPFIRPHRNLPADDRPRELVKPLVLRDPPGGIGDRPILPPNRQHHQLLAIEHAPRPLRRTGPLKVTHIRIQIHRHPPFDLPAKTLRPPKV